MQIAELGILNIEENFTYYEPFIVRFQPGSYTPASYWTTTFSAPDERIYETKYIEGFIRGAFNNYAETDSLNDCRSTEKSFYWDNENQIGYVHLEHDYFADYQNLSYETYLYFSNGRLIYISDQECLPFLLSTPKANQQQDIVNYDKLAFCSGTFELDNIGGDLDYFNELNLYNNTAFNSYIDDEDITEESEGCFIADRADIIRLQAFYIEKADIGIQSVKVSVQDIRKAQDVLICTDLFTETEYPYINDELINEPIPIQYGPVSECVPIPIDNNFFYNVTFRIALEMTDIGTIQVNVNDIWTTVTPMSTDISKGEFKLAEADCRDADGKLYEIRAIDSIGIVNTYSVDVIKELNEYYLGIGFLTSFYDIDEWNSEKTVLKGIGVRFEEQIKLYEAIQKIQNGSNIGFRYEINAEGKRTIRINDDERESISIIYNTNIDNLDKLSTKGDLDKVFSEIQIKYDKNYRTDKLLLTKNDNYKEYVGAEYKKRNTLTVETLLTNETDAEERALNDAVRFKDEPKNVTLLINTPTKADRTNYLSFRIYDVIYAELTPAEFIDAETEEIDGREFLGLRYLKILSINPDPDNLMQEITGQILTDRDDLIYNHYDMTRHGLFTQDHFDFTRTSGQDHYDFTRS